MDFKTKMEYARNIAKEIQDNKSAESIKAELKSEGLYDRDILSIFATVRKIVGESYSKQIRAFLLEDKEIENAQEFASVDKEILNSLIDEEKRKLTVVERRKMNKMIKEGHSSQDILDQVDTRFLSQDKAFEHLAKLEQVKKQNSGGGRMLNIGGGIGLIVLSGVILMSSGRLFYVLPIIGLGMILKGIMTERMAYED